MLYGINPQHSYTSAAAMDLWAVKICQALQHQSQWYISHNLTQNLMFLGRSTIDNSYVCNYLQLFQVVYLRDSSISFHMYESLWIWVKYSNSLTWNKAIKGDNSPYIHHPLWGSVVGWGNVFTILYGAHRPCLSLVVEGGVTYPDTLISTISRIVIEVIHHRYIYSSTTTHTIWLCFISINIHQYVSDLYEYLHIDFGYVLRSATPCFVPIVESPSSPSPRTRSTWSQPRSQTSPGACWTIIGHWGISHVYNMCIYIYTQHIIYIYISPDMYKHIYIYVYIYIYNTYV